MRKQAISKCLPWIACVALTMMPSTAPAVCYQAPRTEVVLLPKFCWAQYCVPNARGPQYSITGCGGFMNHYCPALIDLHLGTRSIGSGRRQHLLVAKEGILYTLRGMKRYPRCPIRAQVEASLREVETLLRFTPDR